MDETWIHHNARIPSSSRNSECDLALKEAKSNLTFTAFIAIVFWEACCVIPSKTYRSHKLPIVGNIMSTCCTNSTTVWTKNAHIWIWMRSSYIKTMKWCTSKKFNEFFYELPPHSPCSLDWPLVSKLEQYDLLEDILFQRWNQLKKSLSRGTVHILH